MQNVVYNFIFIKNYFIKNYLILQLRNIKNIKVSKDKEIFRKICEKLRIVWKSTKLQQESIELVANRKIKDKSLIRQLVGKIFYFLALKVSIE